MKKIPEEKVKIPNPPINEKAIYKFKGPKQSIANEKISMPNSSFTKSEFLNHNLDLKNPYIYKTLESNSNVYNSLLLTNRKRTSNNLLEDINFGVKNYNHDVIGKLRNASNKSTDQNCNDYSEQSLKKFKKPKIYLNPQNSMNNLDIGENSSYLQENYKRTKSSMISPVTSKNPTGNQEFMRECLKTVNKITSIRSNKGKTGDSKSSTVLDIYQTVKKGEFIFDRSIIKDLGRQCLYEQTTPKFPGRKDSDDIVLQHQRKNFYKIGSHDRSQNSLIESEHVTRHKKINIKELDHSSMNQTERETLMEKELEDIKYVLDAESNFSGKAVDNVKPSRRTMSWNFESFCNLQLKEFFYCCNKFKK